MSKNDYWDYIDNGDPYANSLIHYGVLGMKWGKHVKQKVDLSKTSNNGYPTSTPEERAEAERRARMGIGYGSTSSLRTTSGLPKQFLKTKIDGVDYGYKDSYILPSEINYANGYGLTPSEKAIWNRKEAFNAKQPSMLKTDSYRSSAAYQASPQAKQDKINAINAKRKALGTTDPNAERLARERRSKYKKYPTYTSADEERLAREGRSSLTSTKSARTAGWQKVGQDKINAAKSYTADKVAQQRRASGNLLNSEMTDAQKAERAAREGRTSSAQVTKSARTGMGGVPSWNKKNLGPASNGLQSTANMPLEAIREQRAREGRDSMLPQSNRVSGPYSGGPYPGGSIYPASSATPYKPSVFKRSKAMASLLKKKK